MKTCPLSCFLSKVYDGPSAKVAMETCHKDPFPMPSLHYYHCKPLPGYRTLLCHMLRLCCVSWIEHPVQCEMCVVSVLTLSILLSELKHFCLCTLLL